MLHGCRSALILNCLVKSNKGRNLYLYLITKIFVLHKIKFNYKN